MIRIVIFILIFAIFLAFIVFNLDNKCNVSLGLVTFKEIPVFLAAFFSFLLGMAFTIPLMLSRGRIKKNDKNIKKDTPEMPLDNIEKGIEKSDTQEINKDEKSPYGIN